LPGVQEVVIDPALIEIREGILRFRGRGFVAFGEFGYGGFVLDPGGEEQPRDLMAIDESGGLVNRGGGHPGRLNGFGTLDQVEGKGPLANEACLPIPAGVGTVV
jgi:hypothetical protein